MLQIEIPEFANIFEITSAHFQRITSAVKEEKNTQVSKTRPRYLHNICANSLELKFAKFKENFLTLTKLISSSSTVYEYFQGLHSDNTALQKCFEFIHSTPFKYLWETNEELCTKKESDLKINLLVSVRIFKHFKFLA